MKSFTKNSGLCSFFDTNVLISAGLSKNSPAFSCLLLAKTGSVSSVTCQEILDELTEKLQQKFQISERGLREYIAEIRQFSSVVTIARQLRAVPNDPDDDMIIECAIAGKATHIITGDKHLLSLVQYQNIEIVKAKDFLDFLDKNNNHELWTLLNVILLQDIPEERLSAGDVGTLVEKHQIEGLETGYSVEFFDRLGKTITVVTMTESFLRLPTHSDQPSVRLVDNATVWKTPWALLQLKRSNKVLIDELTHTP